MKLQEVIPVLKFGDETSSLPMRIDILDCSQEQWRYKNATVHCQDYFELTWIMSGSGTVWIDLNKFDFRSNYVFFTKPGQVHRFHAENKLEGFVISFSQSFLTSREFEFDRIDSANLLRLFSICKGISIQNKLEEDMKELALKMLKEFNNAFPFRSQVISRFLKVFLIYISRQFEENLQEPPQTRDKEVVTNFVNLIEQQFKEKKMVSEYAMQLFVTPNYLNEIVKKTTGYSAGYHIRQRIALEAKRMGRYSDLCMKEIAYSLGFIDSAHFSKFFKAATGSNFSDFKKEEYGTSLSLS